MQVPLSPHRKGDDMSMKAIASFRVNVTIPQGPMRHDEHECIYASKIMDVYTHTYVHKHDTYMKTYTLTHMQVYSCILACEQASSYKHALTSACMYACAQHHVHTSFSNIVPNLHVLEDIIRTVFIND